MATTSPTTVTDYSDILAAAYRNLGQVNAAADASTAAAKRNYDLQLQNSATGRGKSIVQGHQNVASQGLLDSSIALNQDADINTGYDTQNSGYLGSYTDTLSQLAQKRLDAQNAYDDANIQNQRGQTGVSTTTVDTPGIPVTTPTPSTDTTYSTPDDYQTAVQNYMAAMTRNAAPAAVAAIKKPTTKKAPVIKQAAIKPVKTISINSGKRVI